MNTRRVAACAAAAIIALAGTLWPGSLRTSAEAQQKTGKYEDCRSTPYYCAAGELTVGIGSTGNVKNRRYTDEEIASRWKEDMMHAENCINRYFNGVSAPQRVFDALTDTAFNVGCSGIQWYTTKNGSKARTTLWKYANAENWRGVCSRITDFVNAGGKKLNGLVKRREEFKQWCLSDPFFAAAQS